jgi:hemin uptake protein HemP
MKAAPDGGPPDRAVITTEDLFAHGVREVIIRHGAEEYRLRITRADKLILTK